MNSTITSRTEITTAAPNLKHKIVENKDKTAVFVYEEAPVRGTMKIVN